MNPLVLGAVGIAALLLFLGRGGQAQASPEGQTSGAVGAPGLGGAGDVTVVPPGSGEGGSSQGAFASSGSDTQDGIVSTYTAEPTGPQNTNTTASVTYYPPGTGFNTNTSASVGYVSPAAQPTSTTIARAGSLTAV